METEWMMARMHLYELVQAHPAWSVKQLATQLGYSESWVKKWKKRFRQASGKTPRLFCSQSRAPKTHGRQTPPVVVEAILSLRDELKWVYTRTVGPKVILYHLQHDPAWASLGQPIPRSTHTLWRILKAAGRIPHVRRERQPVMPTPPLEEWELDFGVSASLIAEGLEFLTVVDRGTSILVDTLPRTGYHADTALRAIAQVLLVHGCPARLRFDRDVRFVGSWTTDGYPSAWLRFLWCVGVEPIVCPPRRPDLKPFVERCIRTLKYECLYPQHPTSLPATEETLLAFRHFYNTDRPHQGRSCGNQPPYTAFPTLPTLPKLPDLVDPDRWLQHYHQRVFRRRVNASGTVMVDKYRYYLGRALAHQPVALQVDAQQQVLHLFAQGRLLKSLPIQGLQHVLLPFDDYLALMVEEARSIERHLQQPAARHPQAA